MNELQLIIGGLLLYFAGIITGVYAASKNDSI